MKVVSKDDIRSVKCNIVPIVTIYIKISNKRLDGVYTTKLHTSMNFIAYMHITAGSI